MSGLEPVAYQTAIEQSARKRRHLLLGNGFSKAYDQQRFSYETLAAAGGDPSPAIRHLLAEKSGDIEAAILVLQEQRTLALHGDKHAGVASLDAQIAQLKEHLVRAVTNVHPESAFDLQVDAKRQCSKFLAPYIGRAAIPHGIVFTTNYDLLLYWTLTAHAIFRSRGDILFWDGFKGDHWVPEVMAHLNMSAVYLHGALHIYKHTNTIRRILYDQSGNQNLITQIRLRLDADEFPIYVAEGDPDAKLDRIRENSYLSSALTKFTFACKERDSSLFIVGHRLAKQDRHLSDLIGKGRIGTVYFGAHGGEGSADAENAIKLAERWSEQRLETPWQAPLTVKLFDSKQCDIWRPRPLDLQVPDV